MRLPRSIFSILALLSVFGWSPDIGEASGDQPEKKRPNIVLINLDDADASLFETNESDKLFPEFAKLKREGIWFTNMHVTTPLCGPSRACLYRAQYAHKTGVRVNDPKRLVSRGFAGGHKVYCDQGFAKDDLSVWMKNAGYRTMMVGKYLHSEFQPEIPPGWDDFYCSQGSKYFGTFRFTNRNKQDGDWEQLGQNEYRTMAETKDILRLISRHVRENEEQPFFLNFNPLAPHFPMAGTGMLSADKTHSLPQLKQPPSPSYNRAILNARGPYKLLEPLTDVVQKQDDEKYRLRALATLSVDEMIRTIRNKLNSLGIAENTYIFVTSDNGYVLGQNLAHGKTYPLDRCTRVPCFVVGPGIPANQKADQLIAQFDLGPTFVEIAGGQTPIEIDGRSFVKLLDKEGVTAKDFRQEILIENWEGIAFPGRPNVESAYNSIRMPKAIYTEWCNGDCEYFDLADDPDQLENRFDRLRVIEQYKLSLRLKKLKSAKGTARATFSYPTKANTELETQTISGFCESPKRVNAVSVAIQDIVTKQFWNGESWQSGFARNDAKMMSERPIIGQWSFAIPPELSNDASGSYWAFAWAYDESGVVNKPAGIRFRTKSAAARFGPNSSAAFTFPDANVQEIASDSVLRGTADSPIKIDKVKLTIRDQESNRYWNGDAWSSAVSNIKANFKVVDKTVRWEYRLPNGLNTKGSGRYECWVVAIDSRARYDEPAMTKFTISKRKDK